MEDWVGGEAMIADLSGVEVHQLNGATDFLLEASEDIQRDVYFGVANLLNLDVDVIFFDTTTAYFETGDGAEDAESSGKRSPCVSIVNTSPSKKTLTSAPSCDL